MSKLFIVLGLLFVFGGVGSLEMPENGLLIGSSVAFVGILMLGFGAFCANRE